MYLWEEVNISRIKNMANGSTFQEINKANFRRIKIIVPPESSLRQFDCILSGLWNAIVTNETQNRKLSQIRDSLLPKLMSGKIRVGAYGKTPVHSKTKLWIAVAAVRCVFGGMIILRLGRISLPSVRRIVNVCLEKSFLRKFSWFGFGFSFPTASLIYQLGSD